MHVQFILSTVLWAFSFIYCSVVVFNINKGPLFYTKFKALVAGVVGMKENSTRGSTAGLGFNNLLETTIDINTYKSSNHYRTICTP